MKDNANPKSRNKLFIWLTSAFGDGGRFELSLERRTRLAFLANMFICIALVAFISLKVFTSERMSSMQEIAQRNARQASAYIETKINDMNNISQLMSYEGTVGAQLYSFLKTDDNYSRLMAKQQIDDYIRLITFTNPDVGLVFYYNAREKNPIISNVTHKDRFFDFTDLILADKNDITYYGPHVAQSRFDMGTVLSLVRKVEIYGSDDIYVYIEEAFDLKDYQFNSSDFPLVNFFIVVNADGYINYSQLNAFKTGQKFDRGSSSLLGYRWFEVPADMGWNTIMLVPQAEFDALRGEWIRQMAISAVLIIVIALVVPLLGWQIFYRPVRSFAFGMKMLREGSIEKAISTGIPEADQLLEQTLVMRGRILELIEQVRQKEKIKSDMEIEKLLYQINPHFLMNTINTVQWLAMENNQHEIEQIATSLNKLLYYNLGKSSNTSLRQEINVLQEYISIQLSRYSFDFKLKINISSEYMDLPVPRFILQPLAENAINHGISDGGMLTVSVDLSDDEAYIVVLIKDDGKGMSADIYLDSEYKGKSVMGIGIGYVRGMLDLFYEGKANIEIDSAQGVGTELRLLLPVIK